MSVPVSASSRSRARAQWFVVQSMSSLSNHFFQLTYLVRPLASCLLFSVAGHFVPHVVQLCCTAVADICCQSRQAAMSAALCIVRVTAACGRPSQDSDSPSNFFRSKPVCAASHRSAAAVEDATETSRAALRLGLAAVVKIQQAWMLCV